MKGEVLAMQRTVRWMAVVLLVVVGLGACGRQPAEQGGGADGAAAEEKVQKVSMSLSEFAFSPKAVQADVGELLDISLANQGTSEHELVIQTPTGDIEFELQPGAQAGFGVKFAAAGVFTYVCELPGHAESGMRGQIMVGGAKPATEQVAAPASEGEEVEQEVHLELSSFAFTPNRIETEKGTLLEFTVVNTADTEHEMVVDMDGQEFEVELKAGETRSFALRFAKPGTYTLVCELPGHAEQGMKGEIVVK